MDKARGIKTRDKSESLGKPTAKFFAKLPSNYKEMTEEEQQKWRHKLADVILENLKRHPTRP